MSGPNLGLVAILLLISALTPALLVITLLHADHNQNYVDSIIQKSDLGIGYFSSEFHCRVVIISSLHEFLYICYVLLSHRKIISPMYILRWTDFVLLSIKISFLVYHRQYISDLNTLCLKIVFSLKLERGFFEYELTHSIKVYDWYWVGGFFVQVQVCIAYNSNFFLLWRLVTSFSLEFWFQERSFVCSIKLTNPFDSFRKYFCIFATGCSSVSTNNIQAYTLIDWLLDASFIYILILVLVITNKKLTEILAC